MKVETSCTMIPIEDRNYVFDHTLKCANYNFSLIEKQLIKIVTSLMTD